MDQFSLIKAVDRLGQRVDAPMSRGAGQMAQIRQEQGVQLAHDVALEAALDFFERQALSRPASHILPRARITPHSDHGDSPKRIVRGAVAAPVQAMARRLSRRGLQRAHTAERSQGGFTLQSVWVVARHADQHGGSLRPYAKLLAKPRCVVTGKPFELAVEYLDLGPQC
jgi:hypothetical protein